MLSGCGHWHRLNHIIDTTQGDAALRTLEKRAGEVVPRNVAPCGLEEAVTNISKLIHVASLSELYMKEIE